jgi:hypothetical protein
MFVWLTIKSSLFSQPPAGPASVRMMAATMNGPSSMHAQRAPVEAGFRSEQLSCSSLFTWRASRWDPARPPGCWALFVARGPLSEGAKCSCSPPSGHLRSAKPNVGTRSSVRLFSLTPLDYYRWGCSLSAECSTLGTEGRSPIFVCFISFIFLLRSEE